MRLELWQYIPMGDRHLVLLNDAGVQQADGPLSGRDIRAIQQSESNISLPLGAHPFVSRSRRGWPHRSRGKLA
jgi:hypothetical protein